MTLAQKIKRIRQRVLALARARFPSADVFSFGAVEIDLKNLAVWIKTDTDAQRGELAHDEALQQALRRILVAEDYPSAAVPFVDLAFQSEETVRWDYDGNWWYAVK